ncbi:hypothetical protein BV375_30650 [Nostoc sp. 106C]|nr:hypothetical protein BV375_30650 [Nostoc sp. 106C]
MFCNENYVNAQIIPDETLNERPSTITPNVNIQGLPADRIDGGVIRGANLFHSFQEFNVGEIQRVYFNNPTGINNILARVTGGKVSNILGTLGVDGAANLFLLNPNGIVFGKNARLDVAGSFVASTGSSLIFDNGLEFSAKNSQAPPLLAINVPIGLQYGTNAGSIINQSVLGLKVQSGRTLALLGRDVKVDGGSLQTVGGRIELGGLSAAGSLGLNVDGSNWRVSYPVDGQRSDVALTNGATVIVTAESGDSIAINAKNLDILGGSKLITASLSLKSGNIQINATDKLRIVGTDSSSSPSLIATQVSQTATGDAGDISINAGSLEISQNGTISSVTEGLGNAGRVDIRASNLVSLFNSSISSVVQQSGVGNAGDINIQAQKLSLSNGSLLRSYTRGQGNAGNIHIKTADSVAASGGSFLFTPTLGQGNAGDVTIEAGGQVSFDGVGLNRGVMATSGIYSSVLATPEIVAKGNGGNIKIKAQSLAVTNGATVAVGTIGQGDSGNIEINTVDRVSISGFDSITGYSSQIATSTGSQGKAGDILINTNTLYLSASGNLEAAAEANGNGGNIIVNAKTFEAIDGGRIISTTGGGGNAGNISLNVSDRVTLAGKESSFLERLNRRSQNNGQIVATLGSQFSGRTFINPEDADASGLFAGTVSTSTTQGGNININTKYLDIQDGAVVSVSSLGSTGAGDLQLTANSINLGNKGKITAETRTGNGGNILLNLQKLLLLRNGSQISTTAGNRQFAGDGGNITINSPFIVAVPQENSDIKADAFTGKGGRVNITTKGIFGIVPRSQPTQLSEITASSEFGVQGFVTINTPDVDPARGLLQLPANLVDATQQIASSCTPRGQKVGRFIATGRGGLPLSPNEPLRGSAVITDWVNLPATDKVTEQLTPSPQPIVEAQGWIKSDRGDVMLVAQTPQTNYSSPSAMSCSQ